MEVYTIIRRFGDGMDRRYPMSISGPQDSILTNEVANHPSFLCANTCMDEVGPSLHPASVYPP